MYNITESKRKGTCEVRLPRRLTDGCAGWGHDYSIIWFGCRKKLYLPVSTGLYSFAYTDLDYLRDLPALYDRSQKCHFWMWRYEVPFVEGLFWFLKPLIGWILNRGFLCVSLFSDTKTGFFYSILMTVQNGRPQTPEVLIDEKSLSAVKPQEVLWYR